MIPWPARVGQLGEPPLVVIDVESGRGTMGEESPDALLAMERESTGRRAASLQRQVEELAEQQSLTTHDDEHDPEGVTIASQRAQLQGLLAGARAELEAIDHALERLSAGTYGTCTGCGGDIARQRLMALPATTTCIDCARRAATRRRP
ncbi:TraR/DksA family transcriptional regulator [Pseudonocardia spinosispora]|uniref:TraR/DksA family transcriptional regulator n=1 Tax=Pseudonocardia spinosispora TaxID=103441 RepID=UPI00042A0D9E|nr:TraR/DksA family transcriptional regulator [Pseudonocardia spinosispora]